MTVEQGPGARKGALLRPSFSLAARVQAVAAALALPRRGGASDIARSHGISRQRASVLVRSGRDALAATLAPKPPGPKADDGRINVGNALVQRAVLSLTVDACASNAQTQACIKTILGRHVSTGKISGLIKEGAHRARYALDAPPMPAVPVHATADELYDRGQPVRILMEDDHLAVLHASQGDEVDITTWGVHTLDLDGRGLKARSLVSDEGAALLRATQEAEFVDQAADGADVFHVLYRMSAVVRQLAHQARTAKARVDRLMRDLDFQTQPRHGRGRPRKATSLQALEAAAAKARAVTGRVDAAAYLYMQARLALSPVSADGTLIDETTARAQVATVLDLLRDADLNELATILGGPGDRLHAFRPELAARHAELLARHGPPRVSFVAWAWADRRELHERVPRTQEELQARWGIAAPLEAVTEIWHALRNCHRSSRVIERLNSQVRHHVRAHRGLHQSFLPLPCWSTVTTSSRSGVAFTAARPRSLPWASWRRPQATGSTACSMRNWHISKLRACRPLWRLNRRPPPRRRPPPDSPGSARLSTELCRGMKHAKRLRAIPHRQVTSPSGEPLVRRRLGPSGDALQSRVRSCFPLCVGRSAGLIR